MPPLQSKVWLQPCLRIIGLSRIQTLTPPMPVCSCLSSCSGGETGGNVPLPNINFFKAERIKSIVAKFQNFVKFFQIFIKIFLKTIKI